MSMVYTISDLHLGHVNMAKYRGFESVEEHDERIISNWNKTVKKRDLVILPGDITMENRDYRQFSRLNGRIKVILGNHDLGKYVPDLLKLSNVESVAGAMQYKGAIITHIPIHPAELSRFRCNVHGHMHFKSIEEDGYINVSCEVVEYTPQPIIELMEIYAKQK